jgi:tetratricopeptide (TPR) repeat protein
MDRIDFKMIWNQYKSVAILILVSSLILLSAIAFWLLYPTMSSRSHLTNLPALPALEDQPKVLADFIRNMNDEALKAPMSDEAVGNLGLAYQSNFFYDEAKTCDKRAGELNPHEWRWIYYSALIDEDLGDTKATIEKLDRVLDINPEVSHAWFLLGNSYLKTNSYREAEKAFQKVLALKDFSPPTKSEAELSNSGAFPLKTYASFNLARAAFQQNKLDEAMTVLEKVVAESPKFGPAYRLLGNVYRQLGDEKKGTEFEIRAGDFESYIPPADPMYDQMILSSRNIPFVVKQFDIAAKSENYNWTVTLMNLLTSISPNDAEVLTKRMKLALDMQLFSKVDSLLPTFFRVCGSDEKRLIDMAKYFVYRSQYEPAVVLLKRATTVNPKAVDAHLLFVDVLTEFKQYDMGINYCRELISMEPRNAEIRNRLAGMYIQQGNFAEARQQMKVAQQLSPNDEKRYILLGRMFKKEGSFKNALEYYQKVLDANPRNVNAQLELGAYLLDLRRWHDAMLVYQNSLKTSPNDLDLIERYAWALAVCPLDASGNGEKALELANRFTLRRKYTKDQEMRCGLTLAAAYARAGQFDKALETANTYLGWAKGMRDSSYLHRVQSMLGFFQNKKPYTL